MNLIYGAFDEKVALKYSEPDTVQPFKLDEILRNSLFIFFVGNILAIYIYISENILFMILQI